MTVVGKRIEVPPELVERIKGGDQSALSEIMDICREGLLTYAARLLNDHWAAEEVVDDVFLKLWRFADTLKPDSAPKSWLFRVCHNECVDYLRLKKNQRHESLEALIPDDDMYIRAYKGRDDLLECVVDHLMMERLLDDVMPVIPVAYRTCMEPQVEGYEYPEIATRFGIPLGTVKSRLHYGRTRARVLAERAGWDLGTLTCEARAM